MNSQLNCFTLVNVSVNSKKKEINFLSLDQPATQVTRIRNAYDFLWISKSFRDSWGDVYMNDDFNVKLKNATLIPNKEVFIALWVVIRMYGSLSSFEKSSGVDELNWAQNNYEFTNNDKPSNLTVNNSKVAGKKMVREYLDLDWYNNINSGKKFAAVPETPDEQRFRKNVWQVGDILIEEILQATETGISQLGEGVQFMKYNYVDVVHRKNQIASVHAVESVIKFLKGFNVDRVKEIWEECLYPPFSDNLVNMCNNVIKKKIKAEVKKHQYETFDKYFEFVQQSGILNEAKNRIAKKL